MQTFGVIILAILNLKQVFFYKLRRQDVYREFSDFHIGEILFDRVFDGEFNGDSHDLHWALRIITTCKNVLKIMKL